MVCLFSFIFLGLSLLSFPSRGLSNSAVILGKINLKLFLHNLKLKVTHGAKEAAAPCEARPFADGLLTATR